MASAEPLGFCGYSIVSPKGFFDEAGAEEIINATRHFKSVPPGSVKVHHDVTGFFRAVFDEEKQVLDAIKDYMDDLPAYQPRFFRVARPAEPAYSPSEIASIIPVNKKRVYDFEQVLARLVDGSEHLQFFFNVSIQVNKADYALPRKPGQLPGQNGEGILVIRQSDVLRK